MLWIQPQRVYKKEKKEEEMKKVAYLLVVLMLGFIGVAQAAPSYDYDRIPPTPNNPPKAWITVANFDEQLVQLPSEASYGHLTFLNNDNKVTCGDIVLRLTAPDAYDRTRIQVSVMDDGGVDTQYLEEHPIQFFLDESGETLVKEEGIWQHTIGYLVRVTYQDENGEVHSQYIGKAY